MRICTDVLESGDRNSENLSWLSEEPARCGSGAEEANILQVHVGHGGPGPAAGQVSWAAEAALPHPAAANACGGSSTR